uniref:DNA-directed RNA polymerases I, II, and III subunit RPABC3 n=1 Tax=Noctiluca scintillans TaxID=2966 RepID=A0A7S1ACM0_NOCSC
MEEKAHHFFFEDSFTVKTVDNSRFERSARIDCESVTFSNNMELDINNIIYPVSPGEQVYIAITDNVSPADNPRQLSTAYDHDPRLLGRSIMDQFEYVMFGKIYKKDDKRKDKTAVVFASFGGLLMRLQSDSVQLSEFHVTDSIYLLMRKVQVSGMS